MLKISLDNLQALFAKIAESARLYMPLDQADGTASFGEWTEGTAWSSALNTTKSPKDFFFPQTEDLMKFKTEGKSIEIIDVRSEIEDFVVFGVRACDVKAFDVLDKAGYDQVPTGSNFSCDENIELLVKYSKEHISPDHLLGFMQTTWEDAREPWYSNKLVPAANAFDRAKKSF